MKITIITSPFGFIPPNGYGAVEKIWFDVANEMVKQGHELSFLSKRFDKQITANNIDGIKIKYIKGYDWTGSLKKDLVLDFIYSFKAMFALKKTDVLVLNTFWSPLICFLFFWKYKKTVYNVARFPKGQFKFFKHIDRLSCVSSAVYEALIQQTPSVKHLAKVISNPVNTDVFKVSEVKHFKNDTLRIVYTGRVHPEKGLDLLVKAFNMLCDEYSNIELAIVGPRAISNGGGGDAYIKSLNDLATKFKINWINPVSDANLLKSEIDKATIFCYPSVAEKGETFGVAPLEAMATGCATIVSDLACFKDFISHKINGLVFNHKAAQPEVELKNAIKLLLNDNDLRHKLAKNGASTALDFSNKNIADLYLKDFKQLLN